MDRPIRYEEKDIRLMMISIIIAFGATVVYDMLKNLFKILIPNPVFENTNIALAFIASAVMLYVLFWRIMKANSFGKSAKVADSKPPTK